MKKLLGLLVVLLVVSLPAYAADGDELSTTSFRVNSSGQVIQKILVEEATTNDTVEAGETGKTFIVTPAAAGTVKFTLPTAADGLTYTFVQAEGNTSAYKYVLIDPASTDIILGCINSGTAQTMAVGDALKSAAATGDTVTIVGTDLYWYCTSRVGTWTDNGALNN